MKLKDGIRFIHVSDIHLGSLLHIGGQLSEDRQNIIRESVYEAFERLCNIAHKKAVDFIVISGDLFDSDSPSLKAYSFFIDKCNSLRKFNIDVYVIFGNHDSGNRLKELYDIPINLHIFNSEKPCIFPIIKEEIHIGNIIGQSYRNKSDSRTLHKNYEIGNKNQQMINIALLHTQLDCQNMNYVPCTLNELFENEEIDYWALGHIHKKEIFKSKGRYVVFSGIPQGRDFGEEGLGGAYLVTIDKTKNINLENISLGNVIYKKIKLSIEDEEMQDIRNLSEFQYYLIERIRDILEKEKNNLSIEFLKGFVIQLNIEGKGQLHEVLKILNEDGKIHIINFLNNEFLYDKNFLLVHSINFHTSKKLPPIEQLKGSREIFNVLSGVIKACNDKEKLKTKLLKTWGSIWETNEDNENIDFEKMQIDEELFQQIMSQATDYICEKLLTD